MRIAKLLAQWRSDSNTLREYGGTVQAEVTEHCADQLEKAICEAEDERLTLTQACPESGYSVAHLRRLVSQGNIPNVGRKGSPLVRRGDLPRKPSSKPTKTSDTIRDVLRGY